VRLILIRYILLIYLSDISTRLVTLRYTSKLYTR